MKVLLVLYCPLVVARKTWHQITTSLTCIWRVAYGQRKAVILQPIRKIKIKKGNKVDDIPREVPTRIAVGVARPSAHGQDTTWKKNNKKSRRMQTS